MKSVIYEVEGCPPPTSKTLVFNTLDNYFVKCE